MICEGSPLQKEAYSTNLIFVVFVHIWLMIIKLREIYRLLLSKLLSNGNMGAYIYWFDCRIVYVRGCACAPSLCDLQLSFDLAIVTLTFNILSRLYLRNLLILELDFQNFLNELYLRNCKV